jgi:hypothetical protein
VEDRVNPFMAGAIGKEDTGSRAKAEAAHERTKQHVEMTAPEDWPRGINGQPMMKVCMTASELIPTAQYANVSVGPAQITAFIDPDRVLETDDEGNSKPYFSPSQREVVAQALNELADVVEVDVIGVQRNLVLESMQRDDE